MDSALTAPSVIPLSGFMLRWLAATLVPFCLSIGGALLAFRLGVIYHDSDLFFYVTVLCVLAFPALIALGHGYLMRGLLRRSRLWGVLTGGGSVAGVFALVVVSLGFDLLWAPWIADRARWLAPIIAGTFFGLVVGSMQTLALGTSWPVRLQWCAVSMLAGLLALLWVVASVELEPLRALMDAAGDSMVEEGDWMGVPLITLWSASAVLVYALPTGAAMRRLLRRRLLADAEALARRFD
jgi:hypothetical protein